MIVEQLLIVYILRMLGTAAPGELPDEIEQTWVLGVGRQTKLGREQLGIDGDPAVCDSDR